MTVQCILQKEHGLSTVGQRPGSTVRFPIGSQFDHITDHTPRAVVPWHGVERSFEANFKLSSDDASAWQAGNAAVNRDGHNASRLLSASAKFHC